MGLVMRSEVFVLRLNILGFLFMVGILGLMKEGDAGSEMTVLDVVDATAGSWINRPFMFRGRLGEGDVIGRPRPPNSPTPEMPVDLSRWAPNDVEG